MIKKRFNMKNGIAITICLAGMTVFSGCDNGEPDDTTTSVRLVSSVDHHYKSIGLVSIHEFLYDEQNCITKIKHMVDDESITYPDANTIVLLKSQFGKEVGSDTLSLNAEGAIVSINGNETTSVTYANGYLQKYEALVCNVLKDTGFIAGDYTGIFTWKNGNVKTIVQATKYPDDPLRSSTQTLTYE